jgi:hypothetical protein
MGAVVAFVSGPRTVSHAEADCRVTTISQWLTATEMKDFSGSLRVCQVVVTRGDVDDRFSKANSSTARFMTTSTH